MSNEANLMAIVNDTRRLKGFDVIFPMNKTTQIKCEVFLFKIPVLFIIVLILKFFLAIALSFFIKSASVSATHFIIAKEHSKNIVNSII